MAGEMLAASIMISMMPEDMLLEKAMEALQVYKLTGGAKPRAELMALMMKWDLEGKSPSEIVKEVEIIENTKSVMDRFDTSLQ